MKKIILGCAAVLLSLGLLAGCNNKEDEPPIEEAVVITVDSSASVVVGESLALTYTVSPAKAEVVAASDNEDIVTAVAQEGTLYLEGVAEGSAIVTLVGTYEGYASANKNINVSVITKEEEDTEPGTQVPALTLSVETELSLEIPAEGDPTLTKIEFTVLPEEAEAEVTMEVTSGTEHVTLLPPEEAVEASLEEAWYVTPVTGGTSEIKVSATAKGYTSAEATIVVTIASYVNFSVILEDTGSTGATSWLSTNSGGAMYINGEGSNWAEAGGADGYHATQTMSVNEDDAFYFEFGSTWGPSSDNFNVVIAPDEYNDDLYKDGLGPTDELKEKLGKDATDNTPFLACTTWEETSGVYDGETWYNYKWSLAFGVIDPEYWSTITDLTFVLQADFSSFTWETWSEQDVISDIYFIVDEQIVSSTITEGEPD